MTAMVRAIERICAVLILAAMFYMLASVALRTFTGMPLPAVIEVVTRWVMVPLVFLSLIVTQRKNEHIHVDLLSNIWSEKFGRWVDVLLKMLSIAFLLLLAVASWEAAITNMNRGEWGIDSGLPVWATRFAVPLGCVLFAGGLLREVLPGARAKESEAEGATL